MHGVVWSPVLALKCCREENGRSEIGKDCQTVGDCVHYMISSTFICFTHMTHSYFYDSVTKKNQYGSKKICQVLYWYNCATCQILKCSLFRITIICPEYRCALTSSVIFSLVNYSPSLPE